jgi:pyruvate kinase
MIESGVDVVRLNFSHGTPEEHQQRCELVRSLAKTRGRAVGVLVDLQGPKIRIGKFKDGKITLNPGDRFILDASANWATRTRRPRLQGTGRDVARGATLLLDDGRIEMWVEEVRATKSSARSCRAACCPTTRASTARAAVCPPRR